jgi:hypothetical protein
LGSVHGIFIKEGDNKHRGRSQYFILLAPFLVVIELFFGRLNSSMVAHASTKCDDFQKQIQFKGATKFSESIRYRPLKIAI